MKRQAASGTESVPLAADPGRATSASPTPKSTIPATGNRQRHRTHPVSRQHHPGQPPEFRGPDHDRPLPQPNQAPAAPTNYFAIGDYYANKDNIDIKLNANPNDKSTVFARYSYLPYDIFDPPHSERREAPD